MLPVLVLCLCHTAIFATLPPSLDKGVIVKVSEDVLEDMATVVTDKIITEVTSTVLSGAIHDGSNHFTYWDLGFTSLSLTPSIDLTKVPRRDRLNMEVGLEGSLECAAQWQANRRTWWYSITLDGGVRITSRGFHVRTSVILGEDNYGVVGFGPGGCHLDLGDLDVDFSGSVGWLLNLFVGVFESRMRELISESVCETLLEKVGEAADELETAVFTRYDFVDILGHRIEINNRPSIITGGESCAIVGAQGGSKMIVTDRDVRETEPFFLPTKPSTTLPPLVTTMTTQGDLLSTTSSPPPGKVRSRRAGGDLCEALPGTDRGVSVIITQDMVSRFATDLHNMRLIDYKLSQDAGESESYRQEWGGRAAGTVRIVMDEAARGLLQKFLITIRVTSVATPAVRLASGGITVTSHLRTRVRMTDPHDRQMRFEIHTTVQFGGTLELGHRDGVYLLIPRVSGSARVTQARQASWGRAPTPMGQRLEGLVEEQLNQLLGVKVPELIREELKTGYPLNIPASIVIKQATFQYHEDYIVVDAEDIDINLWGETLVPDDIEIINN